MRQVLSHSLFFAQLISQSLWPVIVQMSATPSLSPRKPALGKGNEDHSDNHLTIQISETSCLLVYSSFIKTHNYNLVS